MAVVNVPESGRIVLNVYAMAKIVRRDPVICIEPSRSAVLNGVLNALVIQAIAAVAIVLIRILL